MFELLFLLQLLFIQFDSLNLLWSFMIFRFILIWMDWIWLKNLYLFCLVRTYHRFIFITLFLILWHISNILNLLNLLNLLNIFNFIIIFKIFIIINIVNLYNIYNIINILNIFNRLWLWLFLIFILIINFFFDIFVKCPY